MGKKTVSILLFHGLLFCGVAGRCFAQGPDAKALLKQARKYEDQRKYEETEAIYRQVVSKYPNTNEGLEAQERLTVFYIERGRNEDAEVGFEQLVGDFSGNAGIARAVDHVADAHREGRKYEKARECYQYIVDRWPQAERAADAQAGVARCSILMGDEAAAQAAIEKLKSAFAGSRRTAKALDNVADEYRKSGRFKKALPLYEYAVEQWPQAEHALESQKGLTVSYMATGDDTKALEALDTLASRFSKHNKLARILCEIGRTCEKERKFDQAKAVYQRLLQQCPDSNEAVEARLDIHKVGVMALVESGKDDDVREAIEALKAELGGHEYLPTVIYKVAVQYHLKAYRLSKQGRGEGARNCFKKAAKIFERVIEEFADSEVRPKACRAAGDCYRKVKEYEKSIRCFQKLVDDYPDFETTWNALFLVGRNYEDLKASGAVEASEADAKIEAAYKQLLEKYPDCKMAEYARLWLDNHKSSEK